MGRGGWSPKRAFGITKFKQNISRTTGVPLTKSGRQRKIGKAITGGGCLIQVLVPILLITLIIFFCF